jgi:hypothetical protein
MGNGTASGINFEMETEIVQRIFPPALAIGDEGDGEVGEEEKVEKMLLLRLGRAGGGAAEGMLALLRISRSIGIVVGVAVPGDSGRAARNETA